MIVITGGTGFVGSALVQQMIDKGLGGTVAMLLRNDRNPTAPTSQQLHCIRTITLDAQVNVTTTLSGVKTVIHLAGRAHIMNDSAPDPLKAFRTANCDYALHVAKQAIAAGVKRFIYISSIKVNGERTNNGQPFSELSPPSPSDPYSISKHEAEVALSALSKETGLELVIIRPPLIYGDGAKGNFVRLAYLTARGIPLPFGAINNSRSLLYVKNLVDFLILCTHHSKAAQQTFVLSDGQDVSTTKILRTLAQAQSSPARLLPVPAPWLRVSMQLLGAGKMADRLLGSLQVDASKAQELLGWTPPFSFETGIRDMFKK